MVTAFLTDFLLMIVLLYLTIHKIFFQSRLAPSLVSDSFLCCRVASIQKRSKDPTSCVNYCPITVSCFLSKLLEHLLLPEIESNCDFTPFHFGFRKSFGCSHAHHVLSRLMRDKNVFILSFCGHFWGF